VTIIVCKQCNVEFDGELTEGYITFCSMSCKRDFQEGKYGMRSSLWKGGKTERVKCLYCSKEFSVWPSRKGRKFCDKKCFDLWQKENGACGVDSIHWKGGKAKCIDCGTVLDSYLYKRCKPCENKCRVGKESSAWKGGKVKSICQFCGSDVWHFPSRSPKFCNRACFTNWKAENWVGENSPGWQGGISEFPYGDGFTGRLRRKIRERDGEKCVLCGSGRGERELYVHHIDYDKDNHDQYNLITLCPKCHGATNVDRPYWETTFQSIFAARTL